MESLYDGQDGDYRIRVPTYQTTAETVLDEVTGLIWQRTPSTTTLYPASKAADYCATLTLDGHQGWRLPSRRELVTIVDVVGNAADPASTCLPPVFDAVPLSSSKYPCHWTSSDAVVCECGVNLGSSELPYARCVWGASAPAALSVSPDGQMVFDQRTGLIWQRQSMTTPPTDLKTQSLAMCEGLTLGGWSDWRLPSMKELSSLLDEQFVNGLDPAIFPGAQGALYQSSSLAISSLAMSSVVINAIGVSFLTNSDDNSDLGDTVANGWGLLRVRCVRN